ncbi:F-box domain-containing protein [Cedratvirus kamchatka]|uniref:F-box domain-containing protein n=1 Tax=Cedratvirus kamchatka TaxID=2716914 RepID=A0A6G8MXX6_9VIRU|nr:F-box domain-containing protein [Cedratvirus kamchatka]
MEKIVVNLSCSDLFRITQVCSDLRNICLKERLWKSKFVRKNIPLPILPSLNWKDIVASIKIYQRCKKIHPQILEKINKKHETLYCGNLIDVPLFIFPKRLRANVLPFLHASHKAKEEEEEKCKEIASRWSHNVFDLLGTDFILWFSLSLMLDGTLLIKRNTNTTIVCFTEQLSREEVELFLLHLILTNGPV